jgi:hypothetical protein
MSSGVGLVRILAADPDTHSMPFVLYEAGKILAVRVARVHRGVTGDEAVAAMIEAMTPIVVEMTSAGPIALVVVEGQQILRAGGLKSSGYGRADPEDILRLAHLAGAASALAYGPGVTTVRPTPATWKGQVPKEAHHRRVLKGYGWDSDEKGRPTPEAVTRAMAGAGGAAASAPGLLTGVADVKTSEWTHVVDAMGLAAWGAEWWRRRAALSDAASRSRTESLAAS